MVKPLVYVVEDDPVQLLPLAAHLRYEGFRLATAQTGQQALEDVARLRPDVMILDVVLPDLSGLAVARQLRALMPPLPILMVTARDAVPDRVAGLTSGADDYLIKPYALEELTARVLALLRRSQQAVPSNDILRFKDVTLYQGTREVWCGTQRLMLTGREYGILLHLMQRPGQAFSRQHLMSRVWGRDFAGTSNVLDVHVRALRAKLDAAGGNHLIQTVRGFGYKLESPQAHVGLAMSGSLP